MARSWQYPRWRRVAMQVTMWVILAATVGLAAFVNHERRRSMRVELGGPIVSGAMSVRLPRTWQQSTPAGDRDGRILARAIEPDDRELGRTVTITCDRVATPVSPLEFLLSSNNRILGLELLTAQHARTTGEQLVEPITVGGWPGVLVRGVRAGGRGASGAGNFPHKELYGATVLPSGHAIVVKLEGDRPAELSDVEIVKQLAGAIEVSAQPTMGQAGEILALDGSVRVATPEGFRPVYETDPNLVRRRLWPDGDATRWTAVELIPCLLAPEENNDETMAIRAMASLHDPSLRDAVVTPDGPRRWRITHPAGSTAAVAAPNGLRGYFLADQLADAGAISGGPRRALMAFFYSAGANFMSAADDDGRAASADAVDAAWNAIAGSVSFVGKSEVGSLLDAGRDEVGRLKKQGLPNLLPLRDDQWWLWVDEADRSNIGWTNATWTINSVVDPTSPPTSGGTSETVFVAPGWGVGGTGGRFSSLTKWDGELRRYGGKFTNVIPGVGETMKRDVKLEAGKLSITLLSRGRTVAEGTGSAPPQYVSGAWLPLLVGKLSGNSPMILKSDAFLAREPIGAPMPMLLLVQPVAEQPPQTDGDGSPLRCLSIRVNGSGESSRWYIRQNGEVHHVSFARGVRRVPSDKKTVWFTLGLDAAKQ